MRRFGADADQLVEQILFAVQCLAFAVAGVAAAIHYHGAVGEVESDAGVLLDEDAVSSPRSRRCCITRIGHSTIMRARPYEG